jgi:DNA mismatch repair protein MutS
VPPKFIEDNERPLKITKGRNLLVEYQRGNQFVRQDYIMQKSSTTIVYGPNGSGKSIFLRTLGDIMYLAQIGCFVPCDKAELPLFRQLFTKFSSQEDSHFQKSLFYQEASEINEILLSCDRHSLILIDEYARATSFINALSLFKTLVDSFTEEAFLAEIQGKKDYAGLPLVMISTNMKELISQKLIKKSKNIDIKIIDDQKKALTTKNKVDKEESLPTSSVHECAKKVNLNPEIIDRSL